MNSYNDNLQQTVSNTLGSLSAQQAKLDSEQLVAGYNLYYAQDAVLTAKDKLSRTQAELSSYQTINQQGIENENRAVNLLASATQAEKNVETTVTNMATAASNIQIASNAVALLASDIGAALNIATASLYDTDIYNKISDANALINDTANFAKNISDHSMDASSASAEISAKDVTATTTTAKVDIENTLKATEGIFSELSKVQLAEHKKYGESSQAESAKEGVLLDANKESNAINKVCDEANKQLNHNLKITVISKQSMKVSFDALPDSLFVASPASKVSIPAISPKYYICFVPAEKASFLKVAEAEQYFARLPESAKNTTSKTLSNAFTPVTAGEANDLVVAYDNKQRQTSKALDIYGNNISAGKSYVAFLYIDLSLEYKKFIGNFSDALSSASTDFTLATKLPIASRTSKAGIVLKQGLCNDLFEVIPLDGADAEVNVEYRCIFLRESYDPKNNFLTALNSMTNQGDNQHIYFTLPIAEQVSPANFLKALKIIKTSGASSGKAKGASKDDNTVDKDMYGIEVPLDITDNFGNQMEAGADYTLYILSVVNGDADVTSQFVSQYVRLPNKITFDLSSTAAVKE